MSSYWGYPEEKEVNGEEMAAATEYKCPESILDQLMQIQRQAGEEKKRDGGEEYSDEMARLERMDREAKCKTPNIINMEFAFTVKKAAN